MEDDYKSEYTPSSFDDPLPSTVRSSPKQNPVAVSQLRQMTFINDDTDTEASVMDVGEIESVLANLQGPYQLDGEYENPQTVGIAASKYEQSLFRRSVSADDRHAAPDVSDSAAGHLVAPVIMQNNSRRDFNSPHGPSGKNIKSRNQGHARVQKTRQARQARMLEDCAQTNSLAALSAAASSDLVRIESGRSEQPDSLNSMESTWSQSFGLSAVSEWNSTAPGRPAGSPQPDFKGSAIEADGTRQPFKSAEALHQELVRNFCEVLCSVGSMSDEERSLKVEQQYRAIAVYKTRRTLQARFRQVKNWVEELRSERKDWWHPPLNLPGGSAEAEKLKQTPSERIPIVEIRWKLCETCFKNKGELLPSCASTGVLTCYCGVPS